MLEIGALVDGKYKILNKVEGRNYEKKHEQRRSEKTE